MIQTNESVSMKIKINNIPRQYNGIDLMKFIASLLVVAMYVDPLTTYSILLNYGIQNYLARISVPFFFISSGYFLFKKTQYDEFDKMVPLKYTIKILRLYLIWTAIYFPLEVYDIIRQGEKSLIHGGLIWIRNFLFSGSYLQLWYLNAMIVAILILTYFLQKHIKISLIITVAFLFYLLGLLPQTYFILLEPFRNIDVVWNGLKFIKKLIITTRNGLFEGFLFMGIGMLFAYKPIVIKKKNALLGFGVSMAFMFCEAWIIGYCGWAKSYDVYIFLVPVSFYLFYLVSHIEFPQNAIYLYLRKQSILIFYIHMIVAPCVGKFWEVIGSNNSLVIYLSVILITMIMAHCIIMLSEKETFWWLKKIYL